MSCICAVLLGLSYIYLPSCSAVDKITAAQFLRDPETIVSSNGAFELGFFNQPTSTNHYVGIWYKRVPDMDVVWVANRNNPLKYYSGGMIRISEDGNLQILNGRNQTFWSSNVSVAGQADGLPVARLLDSGNLVLQGNNGRVLWQSFEHPTDKALPNMKLTVTENSGVRNMLWSWKDLSNPANGRFSIGIDSFAFPQLVIWDWDGDQAYWRSGPWNGNNFIGMQSNNSNIVNAGFILENDRQGTVSLTYSYTNSMLVLSNYELSYWGTFTQKWWDESQTEWETVWQAPETECDVYGKCGAFGSCNSFNSPICRCLKGFEPSNKLEWSTGNRTGGCIRRKPLQCTSGNGEQDGFFKVTGVKVPDNADWSTGLDENECRCNCLNNCSCLAYAYITGAGCMSWGRDLIDTEELSTGGVDLYLRLAHSELGNNSKRVVVVAVTGSLGAASVVFMILLWRWKIQKQGKKLQRKKTASHPFETHESQGKIEEIPLFEFGKLAMATNNFHDSNKLGRGGFGAVYRGHLEDGQQVAVKRLSSASGQGREEFMNEVSVISKLQHRNLVRLLGCCAEGKEQMLIYEYMPNKSLDSFLFDPEKRKLLSWKKRYHIILGICRGLLYLHRDSRLRIIHRDLKASNILLDENLNPKISDFGMARIFWENQDQDDTRRVVGTYGYMSPEYAMGGRFSEKSDVFSFGVLLLEIVSGKRNSLFSYKEQSLSLLGYAYKLWNEGNTISLIDSVIAEPCFLEDIQKCAHVGLLCVQEFTKDRPIISAVISMLGSEITNLPRPKNPGFIHRQVHIDVGSSSQESNQSSINNVSITVLSSR